MEVEISWQVIRSWEATMSETVPIRPSAWYYLLAVPFLLLGMIFFFYTLLHDILHVTDSLTQVVVPGESNLTLKHGVTYTVFYEQHSVVNGVIYSANEPLSGLKCKVSSVSQGDGDVIPLRQASMSTTYDVGGRSGKSVLEFSTAQDGHYRFSCGYPEGSRGPEVVLAVGSGVGEGIMNTILKCFGAIFGGGTLGGIVFLTVYFLRERSKKQVTSSTRAPI
jgi:hypothetical protein